MGRGNDLAVESSSRNPEGRGSIPCLGSRRSSLISIEPAELLSSTPSLVLCCAWLVTMALHVHCGLGQLGPLPTSGDDEWVAAKHCGRAKRSRISDTHRLRSSLQFRYINNQSLLFIFLVRYFVSIRDHSNGSSVTYKWSGILTKNGLENLEKSGNFILWLCWPPCHIVSGVMDGTLSLSLT